MAKWKITNENKQEITALMDAPPKIAMWQLAHQMGIHENTLAKQMRMPNDKQTAAIKAAIGEMRAQE